MLVVGHSNTVPEVITALGVTTPVTIGDDEFDNLFIVTPGRTRRWCGCTTMSRVHGSCGDHEAHVIPRRSRRGDRLPRAARVWCCLVPSRLDRRGAARLGRELGPIWDAEHVSPPLPPLIDHAEVVRRLTELVSADAGPVRDGEDRRVGRGPVDQLRAVGNGPTGVLLWSQMHGDEPTATAALFDIFEYLRRHREDPAVARMLSQLTIHVVPMLNPDGAERFQRRNAQGIDINRDALRLQTPEGRVLKALRDRLNPRVGFNLHNQSWRTSVGNRRSRPRSRCCRWPSTRRAPRTPGRMLTKQLCAVIRDALEPLASGQIGRYDDEFEVRAFGDNITKWGTPVVLIETGPWPSAEPDPALVRLNFVAIVTALDALATGRVDKADRSATRRCR